MGVNSTTANGFGFAHASNFRLSDLTVKSLGASLHLTDFCGCKGVRTERSVAEVSTGDGIIQFDIAFAGAMTTYNGSAEVNFSGGGDDNTATIDVEVVSPRIVLTGSGKKGIWFGYYSEQVKT